MAIFELFSKRQKKLRGEVPDFYQYDEIPNSLRVQIIHIWRDSIGTYSKTKDDYEALVNHNYIEYCDYPLVEESYKNIRDILCREYGLFQLVEANNLTYFDELNSFLLAQDNIEIVIDIVELSFNYLNKVVSINSDYKSNCNLSSAEAIFELNDRFKEHGIGYQFIENKIIRIDSELIHSEAVKPALRLLNAEGYQGAQEEFLSAYEHYRLGKNKESLNDCLKSFESTMKAIISKHGWESGDLNKASAKKLIKTCFDNNLVPSFWESQITSLKSMLESSIPTGRNRLGGHGQGVEVIEVPDYLVAYMLHMTASTLVFLTTAEKDMRTQQGNK